MDNTDSYIVDEFLTNWQMVSELSTLPTAGSRTYRGYLLTKGNLVNAWISLRFDKKIWILIYI